MSSSRNFFWLKNERSSFVRWNDVTRSRQSHYSRKERANRPACLLEKVCRDWRRKKWQNKDQLHGRSAQNRESFKRTYPDRHFVASVSVWTEELLSLCHLELEDADYSGSNS